MAGNYYNYPCNICIVKACCKCKCELYYQFCNDMANNIGTMTADEIHEFRINTPLNVRRLVERFWKNQTRYAFPGNGWLETKERAGRLVR